MKYNLNSSQDSGEAIIYLNDLIRDKKQVEIKEIKPRRSLPQNALLHLYLGIFGTEFGNSIAEAKILYKRLPGNKDMFVYHKDIGGKDWEFLRSSADLTKEQMTKSIDTLREWAGKLGLDLPSPEDKEAIMYWENQISKQERYL